MKHILRIILAVGLVMALATSASALTAATIPSDGSTNDFIGTIVAPVGPIGGYFGGQLYLWGGPANIKIDYYGAEAGYTNAFSFQGSTLFNHPGGGFENRTASPLSTTVNSVSSGLLNFSFLYNIGQPGAGSVVNGANPDNSIFNQPNFFVSFDPTRTTAGGATSGTSVWLFLDDGNTSDDNHDDFLVKLSVTGGNFSVPEPTTLLLLGLGMLGVAAFRRK